MGVSNVLNPSSTSLLNPLYGWQRERRRAVASLYAESGRHFARQVGVRPLTYRLSWFVPKTQALQLEQWANQYLLDFFTIADYERGRFYSGRFIEGPSEVFERNDRYRYTAVFEELPALGTRYAGDTWGANAGDWTRDAIFLEERNGYGEDLLKRAGTGWSFETSTLHHPGDGAASGSAYISKTTNDTATWRFFGCGFRVWGQKANNMGHMGVTCTRVRDGSVVIAEQTVNQYNSLLTVAAALFDSYTFLGGPDLPLDWYDVKLRVMGTKSGPSSDFWITADAVEVML